MNLGLTEDQASILSGLDQLIAGEAPEAPTEPVFSAYSTRLDQALASAGFLDIAREDGFGVLEAAMVTERVSQLPVVVEVAASSIIAPGLSIAAGTRPIALVQGDGSRAARFLPMAQLLLVDRGDDALAIRVDPDNVEPVDTIFAYPYGKLKSLKDAEQTVIRDVATLRRRWRVAIAAEAAGCMAAGLALIVDHVKNRRAFGRPLGAFQAIQHRLAMASETVESAKYLAFRAAWSDTESDAAVAAGFAQMRIAQTTYDLHQFAGAMSLTLEFPLHFWTYRLRALAGELGGSSIQARAAAAATWPVAS